MEFEPIRRARLNANKSVGEVAQAAQKSLGWMYAVERGLCVPSRADAEKIAELLETCAGDLFSRIREEAG